jgi:hypothetical protein
MQLTAGNVFAHWIRIERREDLLDFWDGEAHGKAEGRAHVPDGSEREQVGEDDDSGEVGNATLHHDNDRRTIA